MLLVVATLRKRESNPVVFARSASTMISLGSGGGGELSASDLKNDIYISLIVLPTKKKILEIIKDVTWQCHFSLMPFNDK